MKVKKSGVKYLIFISLTFLFFSASPSGSESPMYSPEDYTRSSDARLQSDTTILPDTTRHPMLDTIYVPVEHDNYNSATVNGPLHGGEYLPLVHGTNVARPVEHNAAETILPSIHDYSIHSGIQIFYIAILTITQTR